MKMSYYNDTKRTIHIHPATYVHGTVSNIEVIPPGEICIFTVPDGHSPWVKMWDYGGENGLQILVSSTKEEGVE